MNASGPTKTSRPRRGSGANCSYGVSDTFIPARFGAASRSRSSTGRDSIAARPLELVHVERHGAHARAAAARCEKSASSSSTKYGGGMTATASAPIDPACSASATVSPSLHPAVHRDLQPAAAGVHERARDLAPLVEVEEHPLPRRAHGEGAVEAAGGEEVDVRLDGGFVESVPSDAEASAPRRSLRATSAIRVCVWRI